MPLLVPIGELRSLVRRALEVAQAPAGSSIAVILARDAELAALNSAHMGQDGPTDVLSFPLLPPASFPEHPGQSGSARDVSAAAAGFRLPPEVPVHLGDVVVSVERAIEQAVEGRGGHEGRTAWGAGDELRLLVAHGVLHLCGWDHADPVEQAHMQALERRVLGLDRSEA